MKKRLSKVDVQLMLSLMSGDTVEAYSEEGRVSQGIVDTAAPELGILWIHTIEGERRIIDVTEHTIQRMPEPTPRSASVHKRI